MRILPTLLLGIAVAGFSGPVLSLPAFPGAQGFGTQTPGGRGGRVIEVTNLNDSGVGSFRDAVEASGPRIVVFRVAGTILVKSKITVDEPYLTVAGQTAPGDGVTIRNDPSNSEMPLTISTHDVVLRYLRVRPGPSKNDGGNIDATDLKSYNIVIDHCSFSWSTDEVFTGGGAYDFTIQWSIIAEGLNNSSHPEGAHSKGLHLRESGANRISVHHNLLAHNEDRNPNINTSGVVDFVNNVVYNASRWSEVKDKFGEPHVNFVNNFYKKGPNSDSKAYEVFYYDSAGRNPKVYVKGNIGFHRPTNDLPQNLIVKDDSRWMIVNSRFAAPLVKTYGPFDAYKRVLAGVGAILPLRDAIDQRVVRNVRFGTGKWVNHPSEVGGWVNMKAGVPPADIDHDGMPDDWEDTYGFDAANAADGNEDADQDGYSNVEEFLNQTDPLAGSSSVNQSPVVKAGLDKAVSISNGAALNGTVSDDGLPSGSTVVSTWSQVSGPGTVSFANPAAVNTMASFSAEGAYVLRLTADDGSLTAFDEVAITVQPPGTQSNILEIRVAASADDAEESASGSVSLTSSDLELVFDGNNQTVGLRFNGVNIPQNATITHAYVQFKADETDSETTSLTIQGENADNAAAFSSAVGNISSRARTAASVGWAPAPWTTAGQADSEQRTTDIAPIVQEIVNRSGWSGGNSLALIISGTGHRTAEAFNGDASGAPLLHIEYNI